jgi:hypothetical protein
MKPAVQVSLHHLQTERGVIISSFWLIIAGFE